MSDILSKFRGKNLNELPTPCFVINEEKFNKNCSNMINNVHNLELQSGRPVRLRPHVKTHKAAQGTFKQLGHGLCDGSRTTDSILVSTIIEANGLLDYENSIGTSYIKDICYSLPACVPEKILQLSNLSKRVDSLRIFVDSVDHLDNLAEFGEPSGPGSKWSIFVKIDMGTHRAGLENGSNELESLLEKLFSPTVSKFVELYGFYAHAGHSYSVTDISEAHTLLLEEIRAVNEAARAVQKQDAAFDSSNLILSVGATPTSNSLKSSDWQASLVNFVKEELIGKLEIHCGNYCLYDLQQICTGCIKDTEIAGFVLGSVVSSYKSRGELLTDTGVLSLSRESSRIRGLGLCVELDSVLQDVAFDFKLYVDRVSQEHGLLKAYNPGSQPPNIKLGTKLAILPQHACITMAQFSFYFVVNRQGIVTDVWTPFQRW